MTFLAFETRVFFTDPTRIGNRAFNYSHEEYSLDANGAVDLFWNTTVTLRPPYSMKNESPFDYYGGVVNALAVFCISAPLVIAGAAMWAMFLWEWFTAWPVPMAAITLSILALIWVARGGLQRWRARRVQRQWEAYSQSTEGQRLAEERQAGEIAKAS